MNQNKNQNTPQDYVVTGLGIITANGFGMDENLAAFDQPSSRTTQDDYRIKDFNPAPHLSDRKVVKVVSHRDVLGLVTLEQCLKNAQMSSKTINPDRTGLYVGAPPSSCSDHHNYEEAIDASVDSYGQLQEKAFGEHFRSASPTTLLTGLPNNVLCYGAKTLDARGPNSNYTTLETSAHMAIIGAMRAMRMGKLDCAISGGYSAHSDRVFAASMKLRGFKDVTPVAEGAAFATIEQRSAAEQRGVKPICQILACAAASDAAGPFGSNRDAPVLTDLIKAVIATAGIKPDDIEIVMTSGSGVRDVEIAEKNAMTSIWNDTHQPILATTAARWGNLMEAGGIAEIGFVNACYRQRHVPEAALETAANGAATERKFNADKPHVMILRATPWGEYSCLVVKMESP